MVAVGLGKSRVCLTAVLCKLIRDPVGHRTTAATIVQDLLPYVLTAGAICCESSMRLPRLQYDEHRFSCDGIEPLNGLVSMRYLKCRIDNSIY